MLHYRAYLLDEHRRVISAANLYCADEQAAIERAQQLVDANDVELWQLGRRIAVFKSGSRPSADYWRASWKTSGCYAPRIAGRDVELMASQLWGVCYLAELQRPIKPSRVHNFHNSWIEARADQIMLRLSVGLRIGGSEHPTW